MVCKQIRYSEKLSLKYKTLTGTKLEFTQNLRWRKKFFPNFSVSSLSRNLLSIVYVFYIYLLDNLCVLF